MQIALATPTFEQFEQICSMVHQMQLDNRDLQKEQFVIALDNGIVAGFGRLRKYPDCEEICSIGVLPAYRNNHIGKALVEKLISLGSNKIYLVYIIPDYFKQMGFTQTMNYPKSIQQKMNYCAGSLPVPETYVAMVLEKQKA